MPLPFRPCSFYQIAVTDEKGTAFVASIVKGIEPTGSGRSYASFPNGGGTFGDDDVRPAARPRRNIPQQDSAERAFNKLSRTFAAQMEALKRYRTGGRRR